MEHADLPVEEEGEVKKEVTSTVIESHLHIKEYNLSAFCCIGILVCDTINHFYWYNIIIIGNHTTDLKVKELKWF